MKSNVRSSKVARSLHVERQGRKYTSSGASKYQPCQDQSRRNAQAFGDAPLSKSRMSVAGLHAAGGDRHAAKGQTMWAPGVEAIMLAGLPWDQIRNCDERARIAKEHDPAGQARRCMSNGTAKGDAAKWTSKAKVEFLNKMTTTEIMSRDEVANKLNMARRVVLADELTAPNTPRCDRTTLKIRTDDKKTNCTNRKKSLPGPAFRAIFAKSFERWCPEVRAAPRRQPTISVLDRSLDCGANGYAKRSVAALRAIARSGDVTSEQPPGGVLFRGARDLQLCCVEHPRAGDGPHSGDRGLGRFGDCQRRADEVRIARAVPDDSQ